MAGPMFNLYSERFDNDRRDMTSTPSPSYEDSVNTTRRMLSTTNDIAPYLGLRARLSQVWFNRWTVLLSLVVVRVLLATQSLDSDLDSARREALSACTSVESMGSAMASMPHYMSQGVNELAAMGIEGAVQALENTLLLMITGVQEIVVFVINLITSTYICLITLALQGSIGVVVDAAEKIKDAINKTIGTLVDGMSSDLKNVEDSINKALGKIKGIADFLGADLKGLKAKFPDVNKLKNIQIPDGFQKDLEKIRDNMPTFEEVQKAANDAIRIPFRTIQQNVNESIGTYSFDRTIFPVPEKERLTFCSDNSAISDFFGGLKGTVNKVKNILVGVVATLAVLAMIPMGYLEWRSWRTTNSRAHMLHTEPTRDPLDFAQIVSRPYSSGVGLKTAGFFRSSRQQTLVRWAVAYVTSTPALFVVSLGIAGLLSVFAQYLLLRQVEIAAPELAAEVGEFAEIVVKQLTAASEKWAIQTNQAINKTNGDLNKELFGWVSTGTTSLNDTLTVFVDKMYSGVDQFLGGTPLANPIKDVLNCLIGIKVKGIQNGLTWAHDNARVTFPMLPNNTFSVGAIASKGKSSSFLADPSTKAADGITAVIVRLTTKWKYSIREEAIISACILLIWVVVLVIAIVRTVALFFTHDKHRGEIGGGPPAQANINVPLGGGPPAPAFSAFDGNVSPVSSASSEEKSVGADGQWVQVGAANSTMNVEGGSRVQSVYPTYGSGGSAGSKGYC